MAEKRLKKVKRRKKFKPMDLTAISYEEGPATKAYHLGRYLYRYTFALDVGEVDPEKLEWLSYHARYATQCGYAVPEPVNGVNHYVVEAWEKRELTKQQRSQALKRAVRERTKAWKMVGVEPKVIDPEWELADVKHIHKNKLEG